MATLTILRQSNPRSMRIEIDLDQWERLADVFGFYQPSFVKTLRQSLKESTRGRVRTITSLRELESPDK